MRLQILLILIPALIFLVVGIFTLSNYGINWDEPQHFSRGQAYLHFFLTGKTNYLDLPRSSQFSGDSDFMDIRGNYNYLYLNAKRSNTEPNLDTRRSYYQKDEFNFDYYIKNDSGHPPLNGISASFFNFIFFQKLNILGDIESYHLFEIFISFLLVVGVCIFTYLNFGYICSFIAGAILSSYPLFFSESHFNIKDPVEASFFGLTIIVFYFGVSLKNFKFILLSTLCFGLALGTKFNALFLLPILTIWFVFYMVVRQKKWEKFYINLLIIPLIGFLILFLFWPYLWVDPVWNLYKILNFYKDIGSNLTNGLEKYIFFGINIYPIFWIVITTPIATLILFLLGLLKTCLNIFKKNDLSVLLLLWFFVPIIRVSLPHTNIYGGDRQIMEFIPAMAIISSLGVKYLIQLTGFKLKNSKFTFIFLLFLITMLSLPMIKMHPNENVYFNSLIGGLSGAKEKNIPSWGNSFGNAYLQAVQWLNLHTEKKAKLGLPLGNMENIPRIKLRPDINFSNANFSGLSRLGEYEIELSHDYPPKNWFSYSYLDIFLTAVYEIKVDGVAIAKIWKNDFLHTKQEFQGEASFKPKYINIEKAKLLIDLGQEINLTRVIISHDFTSCQKQKGGYIALATEGNNWSQEPEPIEYPQMNPKKLGYDDNQFFFLFAAKKTRYIMINTEIENSCILKNPEITVQGLRSKTI